jgi:hypothetical protein
MPSKKAATKPGFTILSASSDDNPHTKEDDPDNDFNLEDNDPQGNGDPTHNEQPKSPKWALTTLFNMLLICASSLANLLW